MDDQKRIALVETLTIDNGTNVAYPLPVQRYQFDNHLGSASLELDDLANVISYEEYYPYGETSYRAGRTASEVNQKRYRYTGKEKDEESGLYYHGARYYACWLGRWISVDPEQQFTSSYLYAANRYNPINSVDKDGRLLLFFDEKAYLLYEKCMEKGSDELKELLKKLDDSENIYSFSIQSDLTFKGKGKTIVEDLITYSGSEILLKKHNDIGTFIHELFHAYENEFARFLNFDAFDGKKYISSEVRAFRFQFSEMKKMGISLTENELYLDKMNDTQLADFLMRRYYEKKGYKNDVP